MILLRIKIITKTKYAAIIPLLEQDSSKVIDVKRMTDMYIHLLVFIPYNKGVAATIHEDNPAGLSKLPEMPKTEHTHPLRTA